jgi:hypothetical protein
MFKEYAVAIGFFAEAAAFALSAGVNGGKFAFRHADDLS